MAKVTSTKSKGRLTKKELKQDRLVELAYKFEHFYARHSKWILSVAVGIVVVIALVVVVRKSMQSGRMEDSYRLTMAKMSYGQGRQEEARSAFEQILSGGSRSAGEAEYFLGRIAFDKGDFAGAEAAFTEYRKRYAGDEPLDVAVAAGLAACYEAAGRLEESAKAYADLAEAYPRDSFAAQALWEASRIYLKIDQIDNAKTALRSIRDRYPDSVVTSQAKRKLDALP